MASGSNSCEKGNARIPYDLIHTITSERRVKGTKVGMGYGKHIRRDDKKRLNTSDPTKLESEANTDRCELGNAGPDN